MGTLATLTGDLRVIRAGALPFDRAWAFQRELAARGGAWLLLLEHPPVFTLGRFADPRNVLDAGGIPVVQTDRGGDVTYHGPGQIVGYPVWNLRERRLTARTHVERLERAIATMLAEWGVAARAKPGCVGVWADRGKIASIGVRVSRGVAMHGFAINVSTDLAPFARINPCGVRGAAVTSVERELGRPATVDEAARRLLPHLFRGFRFASINYEIGLGDSPVTG